MKRFTAAMILGDITEADFLQWKHHPVTKVYLRWLKDYERELERLQVDELRNTDAAIDPFRQGEFKGRISAIAEASAPSYESIVKFYPQDETQEEDNAS